MDAFIYATFSINLVTLGLFIISQAHYIEGNMATAVIVSGLLTLFQVIVYASLISAMPRAGGDYVWQSRILGRAIGFILAVTGWWFILWLWVPFYGDFFAYNILSPLNALAGAGETAVWWQTSTGLFVSSLIIMAIVFVYIAMGMKWYARVQKFCFWGGMVGLLAVFALLLFGNQETFIANLNSTIPAMFGTDPSIDVYQATMDAGVAGGNMITPLGTLAFGASFALFPYLVFFNLWPVWGSTLYGEVRGASDYKKNFWGMAAAVIVTIVLLVIFFALIAKTLGWDFYNNANAAFWAYAWGYGEAPPIPIWPFPGFLATLLTTNTTIRFIVILLMSLWWFGWSGTIFLSSTRVIFAAAFDRMLPEWAAKVEPRSRTPINALLLMVIPGTIIAYLVQYDISGWGSITLDAASVIAVTFYGTTVAAIILPWKLKDVFEGSPISKFKVNGGLSWLVLLGYAAASIYLIISSIKYIIADAALASGAVLMFLYAVTVIVTVINAGVLLYLLYTVGKKLAAEKQLSLVTWAGLIFLPYLSWLLIEWFWNATYGVTGRTPLRCCSCSSPMVWLQPSSMASMPTAATRVST
jgi:amino acid transporter